MSRLVLVMVVVALLFSTVLLGGSNDAAFVVAALEKSDLSEKAISLIEDYISRVEFELPRKEVGFNVVLLMAIIEVETNFRNSAVGDGGKAHGLFQLHQEAIDQVAKVKKDDQSFSWSRSLKVDTVKKYPLRQFQVAVEYLSYWYSYGGTETMLRYWNYTEAWRERVDAAYPIWYARWLTFHGINEKEEPFILSQYQEKR